MQRITLIQARPGMVLAEPAENEQGMVVCGPGTALDETLIARLERFNVQRITVEGHPVKKRGEDKSEEEQLAELDQRFSKHEDNELMMEIKQVFRDRLHERITEAAAEESGDAVAPE